MVPARETVELLVQAASARYFDGDRQGLRDIEWTALRFLSCANKFSRTPSALAAFIGTAKATASQIAKTLEEKSLLARKPSQSDKRSVMLCVTTVGEKLLAEYDPINSVVNAVASLAPEDGVKLRGFLHEIVARVDRRSDQAESGHCRDCIFLVDVGSGPAKSRTRPELLCRFHRTPIAAQEVDLLCMTFQRRRD